MPRQFTLLDLECEAPKQTFVSQCARDAALKAATQLVETIVLLEFETGKLSVFSGSRRPLREEEQTDYTRRHQLVYKPVVQKMCYHKFAERTSLSPGLFAEIRRLLE